MAKPKFDLGVLNFVTDAHSDGWKIEVQCWPKNHPEFTQMKNLLFSELPPAVKGAATKLKKFAIEYAEKHL